MLSLICKWMSCAPQWPTTIIYARQYKSPAITRVVSTYSFHPSVRLRWQQANEELSEHSRHQIIERRDKLRLNPQGMRWDWSFHFFEPKWDTFVDGAKLNEPWICGKLNYRQLEKRNWNRRPVASTFGVQHIVFDLFWKDCSGNDTMSVVAMPLIYSLRCSRTHFVVIKTRAQPTVSESFGIKLQNKTTTKTFSRILVFYRITNVMRWICMEEFSTKIVYGKFRWNWNLINRMSNVASLRSNDEIEK